MALRSTFTRFFQLEAASGLLLIAAAALALIPIVIYDRYAKRHEILTYTILRLF